MGQFPGRHRREGSVLGSVFVSDQLDENILRQAQFGIPLDQITANSDEKEIVPKFLQSALELLNMKCAETPNLYSTPGNPKTIDWLISKIEFGELKSFDMLPASIEKRITPYDVAGLVLKFFARLPEPLLLNLVTCDLLKDKTGEESFEIVKGIVNSLPPTNLAVVKLLVTHLNCISASAHLNGMTREKLLECTLKSLDGYIPVFHILLDYSEVVFDERLEKIKSSELMNPSVPVLGDIPTGFVFNEIRKTSLHHLSSQLGIDRVGVLSEGESESDEEEEEINKYNSLMNLFRHMSMGGFDSDDDEDSDPETKGKDVKIPLMDEDGDWEDDQLSKDPLGPKKLTDKQKQALELQKPLSKPKKTLELPTLGEIEDGDDEW